MRLSKVLFILNHLETAELQTQLCMCKNEAIEIFKNKKCFTKVSQFEFSSVIDK